MTITRQILIPNWPSFVIILIRNCTIIIRITIIKTGYNLRNRFTGYVFKTDCKSIIQYWLNHWNKIAKRKRGRRLTLWSQSVMMTIHINLSLPYTRMTEANGQSTSRPNITNLLLLVLVSHKTNYESVAIINSLPHTYTYQGIYRTRSCETFSKICGYNHQIYKMSQYQLVCRSRSHANEWRSKTAYNAVQFSKHGRRVSCSWILKIISQET